MLIFVLIFSTNVWDRFYKNRNVNSFKITLKLNKKVSYLTTEIQYKI